jgi:hypothetical protein
MALLLRGREAACAKTNDWLIVRCALLCGIWTNRSAVESHQGGYLESSDDRNSTDHCIYGDHAGLLPGEWIYFFRWKLASDLDFVLFAQ